LGNKREKRRGGTRNAIGLTSSPAAREYPHFDKKKSRKRKDDTPRRKRGAAGTLEEGGEEGIWPKEEEGTRPVSLGQRCSPPGKLTLF